MDNQDQLKLLFDLDLEGNYTEFQFKEFLAIYRKKYREIYATSSRLKDEKDTYHREAVKLQDELNVIKQKLQNSLQDANLLRNKLNTKLSIKERLTGKIKSL